MSPYPKDHDRWPQQEEPPWNGDLHFTVVRNTSITLQYKAQHHPNTIQMHFDFQSIIRETTGWGGVRGSPAYCLHAGDAGVLQNPLVQKANRARDQGDMTAWDRLCREPGTATPETSIREIDVAIN